MRFNRMLLSGTLLVVALVVQVSVLARLQLPGATPDLLLLTVLGLALVYGHTSGALIGFTAGLLADLAPPADHAVGRYALVLCVVGYAAGLTKPETGQHRSATAPMLVVGVAALASTLLYAGVGALVGDGAARHVGLGGLLLTATLYDLLLAPFTVPLVMILARRADPDPLADAAGGTGTAAESAYRPLATATAGSGGPTRRLFGRRSRTSGWSTGRTRWTSSSGGGGGRGLLNRSTRLRAGRVKGAKRL
ncbi:MULTISPECIES: rod shape-determining protein MreD [unclassified Streptomyces]|uniref:rod shape-determining protein MreD n=1 Tax=unclassified Streptomyces TaxID=2593676 RepID=UPI0022B6485D|nr:MULTISPECIES: rod shape-determining protein MreD [unclassified Streptomyces]MCZ7414215.1 rod shape-determining protein MreD [Streptomyces sp. WMMC897]MCZ7431233.1 rod shape-determining protein MreD [Streptomyces sp. WMMC1477]